MKTKKNEIRVDRLSKEREDREKKENKKEKEPRYPYERKPKIQTKNKKRKIN